MEFFFFVRLAHKGFYHAHALDIFLNRIVQSVVLTEYPFKQRTYLMDHGKQSDPQNRDDHQEDQRHLPPIINAIVKEKINISGLRIASRISIINASWTFITSVVILVTKDEVENLSMFSKEKS